MMGETSDKARIGSARLLARQLLKSSKIKVPPTSLSTVIAHLQTQHDLHVYAANFSDRLSGMLVTVENESRDLRRDEIHYNENHSWHRRRFSIAHEIGHLLFNTTCTQSGISSYDGTSISETEANQFASELLIPLAFLKEDFKSPDLDIGKLAWKYIVSEEAMGWKIASTNLLK